MPEFLMPVLEWLNSHPHWAGLVLFLVACGESLALVGLFVPGAVLMFAAGALIASGRLEFWPMMAWATAGAIVGDGASFALGRHFGDRLAAIWPFRTHPALLERGVAFFRSHGGKSVMLGRFVGPIRPVIPAVAGMMGMSASRFLAINVASALLWAPAYLLPGMAFAASLALAAEVLTRLLVIAVAVAAVGWVIYRVTHRSLRRILAALFGAVAVALAVVLLLTTLARRAEWEVSGSVTPETWRSVAEQRLPPGRLGLFGGEPFDLRVVAHREELRAAAVASGWRTMRSLEPAAVLGWLSPEARPVRLAVLPHFHLGRLPDFVAVRPSGERVRWVLRGWRSDLRLSGSDRPVWLLTLERERLTPGLLWVRSEDEAEAAGRVEQLTADLGAALRRRAAAADR